MLAQLGIAGVAYNLVVAIVYAYDKRQAKRGGWRVSERALLGLASVGGAAGALVGMHASRHKTRKPRFSVGVPLLLVVQIGGVGAWLYLR
ncbi:hypothetical protein DB30_07556 [Enhygromyxa salina]|uniref:DUF1294 domain-containing protein n=1 Tax=Enhygromyxa salina TaxID=215803 RepID=A0A0C2CVT4_9BACT|nr:DUF1294 domain-containing protein [Enhygromyxa salina]KIG13710.1 hypothetical protein DB30_07556 [Enhygromyxa salina]